MKKHIKIKCGFLCWNPTQMKIIMNCKLQPHKAIKYTPYIIEWWLHNIGYYLTKPFARIPVLKRINERCKDVDLIVRVKE
jgi:hypothetical protein